MNPGIFRQTISVAKKVVAGVSDTGQPNITYPNVTIVRAMVEPLSGRKLEVARQRVPLATHRILMRYLPTLSVSDLITLDDGTHLYIGAIIDQKLLHFFHEVLCTDTPNQ